MNAAEFYNIKLIRCTVDDSDYAICGEYDTTAHADDCDGKSLTIL